MMMNIKKKIFTDKKNDDNNKKMNHFRIPQTFVNDLGSITKLDESQYEEFIQYVLEEKVEDFIISF